MDESAFSILAFGFREFAFGVGRKIKQLVDVEINDSFVRDVLYLLIKNQLNARLYIALKTRRHYTQLMKAVCSATSIFNYKFLKFPQKDSNLILLKKLLKKAFTRNRRVRKIILRVEKDVISMSLCMKEFGRIPKEAYYNNTLNATELRLTKAQFISESMLFLQSRSILFKDFIQWPVDQLNIREERFLQWRNDFLQLRDKTFGYFSSVDTLVNNINMVLLTDMKTGIEMLQSYLFYGNISKLEVAEHFSSKEMKKGVNKLRLFFETVRIRGQDIYDSWDQLFLTTRQMWNFTLSQTDLMRYWSYMNLTRYLRNYTVVAEEIAEEYSEYQDMIDVICTFHNKDKEFLQSLESLMEHIEEFHATSKIDFTFVRDNFLKVDIFYRELSYEKITQQKAYDLFALSCDIGCSKGLFIGTSVMTIFEILDLIMHHTMTSSQPKT